MTQIVFVFEDRIEFEVASEWIEICRVASFCEWYFHIYRRYLLIFIDLLPWIHSICINSVEFSNCFHLFNINIIFFIPEPPALATSHARVFITLEARKNPDYRLSRDSSFSPKIGGGGIKIVLREGWQRSALKFIKIFPNNIVILVATWDHIKLKGEMNQEEKRRNNKKTLKLITSCFGVWNLQ